jgi:hypothetical protein
VEGKKKTGGAEDGESSILTLSSNGSLKIQYPHARDVCFESLTATKQRALHAEDTRDHSGTEHSKGNGCHGCAGSGDGLEAVGAARLGDADGGGGTAGDLARNAGVVAALALGRRRGGLRVGVRGRA